MKIIQQSTPSIFVGFIFLFFNVNGFAQTCCSGGVPVSGNLGLPTSSARTLQFSLSYDFNNLNTLKTEREVIDDKSRKRTTHSLLFETGYSFSNRFSIDAFFSYVRQERLINNQTEDFTYTQGIGDMVVLLKYVLKEGGTDRPTFAIGGGTKIPIGDSDKNHPSNGLPLNADLQPGSGAFDLIGWTQWSKPLSFRPSMSISSTAIYSYKGVNDSYLGENDYQFGQELSWAFGVSEQIFFANQIVNPSLQLRYRNAQADLFNNDKLPSTGGDWLFVIPGVSWWLSKDFSLETNVELPLLARVEGTQVTPTYRWNVGLFYRIPFKDKNENILIDFSK